jgi:hypothetical protein
MPSALRLQVCILFPSAGFRIKLERVAPEGPVMMDQIARAGKARRSAAIGQIGGRRIRSITAGARYRIEQ